MMEGAHLQIPRVPNEGKLEQFLVEISGKHLVGGDRLGVTGKFAGEAVPGQGTQPTQEKEGNPIRILPLVPPKCHPNARSTRLRDMDKEKLVPKGKKHLRGSSALGWISGAQQRLHVTPTTLSYCIMDNRLL
jgi:hypothetical protein